MEERTNKIVEHQSKQFLIAEKLHLLLFQKVQRSVKLFQKKLGFLRKEFNSQRVVLFFRRQKEFRRELQLFVRFL
jgi:hypothetical protein